MVAVHEKLIIPTEELPSQITDTVVMVRPDHFGFNPETADTNSFQGRLETTPEEIKQRAFLEFTRIVYLLRVNGVTALVLPSKPNIVTPDAVFPNNWFTHHSDGTLVLYPMLAPNRRKERQVRSLSHILQEAKIPISRIVNLTEYEHRGMALEGTGALVLDREHKVAFAIESPRAAKAPFDRFCRELSYEGVFFHAHDEKGEPIYHTNVIMSIGEGFAVICLESIIDPHERDTVVEKLKTLGKEIIPITIAQMKDYGANILQLATDSGDRIIILSKTALASYGEEQRTKLKSHGRLVSFNMPTIETIGGGSARCILAEVFR